MATAPELLAIPEISATERGRRLRRLRVLAAVSQAALAEAMGYEEGGSSSISRIEAGTRWPGDLKARKAINYLAAKGDLTHDASVLYRYLIGEHDSLTSCIDARLDSARLESHKGHCLSVRLTRESRHLVAV